MNTRTQVDASAVPCRFSGPWTPSRVALAKDEGVAWGDFSPGLPWLGVAWVEGETIDARLALEGLPLGDALTLTRPPAADRCPDGFVTGMRVNRAGSHVRR